jgi:hypothetical protein
MRIDIYHHHKDLEINFKLNEILMLLRDIRLREEHMSIQLDALTEQVAKNEDLENSAIELIIGIATQLAEIKDDPVKIQALADSLKVSADNLAAAIVANTPAG